MLNTDSSKQYTRKFIKKTDGTKYSGTDGPSEICGRQSLKNFTWSILEYFVPDMTLDFKSNQAIIFDAVTQLMVTKSGY